jgi:Ca2+-binding RTX toxin-like protein
MSDVINDYYLNAQLSMASYAIGLDPGMTTQQFRDALTDAGFSGTQADVFINRYFIVDSQQNTDQGFSGAVFLDKETGELAIAVRGTETPLELATIIDDIGTIFDDVGAADFGDIGGNGIAASQAIDMFNYLQILTAKAGEPVIQYTFTDFTIPLIGSSFLITSVDFGLATIDGPLAGKQFSVNGHSLGGHLALILGRLAADQVSGVFTYNAPGFDTTLVPFNDDSEEFFEKIRDQEILETGASNIGLTFDTSLSTNLVVPNDVVSDIGTVPGTRIEQFTETASGDPITSHSIQKVTDVLAVSNLLATIDPNIPQIKLLNILKAGSNHRVDSLESIVSQLRAVVFSEPVQPIATDDREKLYGDIFAINDLILTDQNELETEFVGLTITDISGFSSSDLLALSQDSQRGLAFRYALSELSTFVIEGNDTFYDSTELNEENFSDSYLIDRSKFLETKIRVAVNGVIGVETFSPSGGKEFVDVNRGLELITSKDVTSPPEQRFIFGTDQSEGSQVFNTSGIEDHVYGGGGVDTIFGQGGDDYIEGNADGDSLHGDDGDDTIIGGDGNDTLNGGEDNDTLYGDSNDPTNTTLTGNDTLNGDVGNDILIGGDGADILDGGDDNDTLYGDSNDPANTTATGADTLIGGKGQDILKGGKDNDILYGGEKNGTAHVDDNAIDTLEGGDGNDSYFVGHNDIINDSDRTGTIDFNGIDVSGEFIQQAGDVYKNETSGLILTIGGNDATIRKFNGTENTFFTIQNFKEGENFNNGDFGITLTLADDPEPTPDPIPTTRDIFGDRQIIDQDPGTPGEQVAFDDLGNIITDPNIVEAREDDLNGSTGNDNIDAGEMDDTVTADAGDDSILGGSGDDVLEGGAGNDFINGGSDNDQLFGDDGVDVIDGGDGDDLIEGGTEKDFLDGGADRDIVLGNEGDDLIEGGTETDILLGGEGDDEIYADSQLDIDTVFDSATVQAGDSRDWINGGAGDDIIIGSTGQNGLAGGGGNDLIAGGAGDDHIFGDNDWRAQDFDWTVTNNNNTYLYSPVAGEEDPADSGADTIYGGGGNDVVFAGQKNDIAFGDAGDDFILGEEGNDSLYGGTGVDTLLGDGSSVAATEHGDDYLDGGDDDDILIGGGGNDLLLGGEGSDQILGDDVNSQLDGAFHGDDLIDGGAGNDFLFGLGGSDSISGGDGNDQLIGDDSDVDAQYHGNDLLDGGAGEDILIGGGGEDSLFGGDDNDQLLGDASDLDVAEHKDDFLNPWSEAA